MRRHPVSAEFRDGSQLRRSSDQYPGAMPLSQPCQSIELIEEVAPHNRQALLRDQGEILVLDGSIECHPALQHFLHVVAKRVMIPLPDRDGPEDSVGMVLRDL